MFGSARRDSATFVLHEHAMSVRGHRAGRVDNFDRRARAILGKMENASLSRKHLLGLAK